MSTTIPINVASNSIYSLYSMKKMRIRYQPSIGPLTDEQHVTQQRKTVIISVIVTTKDYYLI